MPVENNRVRKVLLYIDKQNAVIKEDETGVVPGIDVVLNFELEREILGFGENIKVLAPGTGIPHHEAAGTGR